MKREKKEEKVTIRWRVSDTGVVWAEEEEKQ